MLIIAFVLVSIGGVLSLNNGLALTPPMGWMSWERFRCVTDCVNYPDDCISENLFKSIADHLESDGFLDAGYKYLIIDDCWLATERDADDRLQPDPDRFPSGIKVLADYIHSKGLKFGLYEDYGTNTCAGFPGIIDHIEQDIQTFADWGVDYIKLDGCYADFDGMEAGYVHVGQAINATGRPIVFSCSFPAYEGDDTNYTVAVDTCNLWRNYGDIQDSWTSVVDITQWFASQQENIVYFAGPGHWNDPDMLIIGNFGLSLDQSIAQMAIWSILAAPLIMSNDLRSIRDEHKEILLNPDAIRINQDPLGMPGILFSNDSDIYIWIKARTPQAASNFGYAIAVVNFNDGGGPVRLSFTLDTFSLSLANVYGMKDVFGGGDTIMVTPSQNITIDVNPTGAVLLDFVPMLGVNKLP